VTASDCDKAVLADQVIDLRVHVEQDVGAEHTALVAVVEET
jgi:hypothetical protein